MTNRIMSLPKGNEPAHCEVPRTDGQAAAQRRITDLEILKALNGVDFIIANGDQGFSRLYIFSRATDRLLFVEDVPAGERPLLLD